MKISRILAISVCAFTLGTAGTAHADRETIIGGALGNGLDRIVYGAVVDFVHFHVGSFSWYIFNIADAAIVFGVLGLLWESLRPGAGRSEAA